MNKVVKIIIFFSLYFVMNAVLLPAAWCSASGSSQIETSCRIPASSVKVTLKQEGDKPVYRYTIHNDYKLPIFIFIIADIKYEILPIDRKYKPKQITGPEGWVARRVFQHEGRYMSYKWSTLDDAYKIQPGTSLNNFMFELPAPAEIIKELPFTIYFKGSECSSGYPVIE